MSTKKPVQSPQAPRQPRSGMDILRHPATKVVGFLGLSALAIISARRGHETFNTPPPTNSAEVQLFQGGETLNLDSATYVFPEGTSILTTPEVNPRDPSENEKGNTAMTVGVGDALVVVHPLAVEANDGGLYFGFQKPLTEGDSEPSISKGGPNDAQAEAAAMRTFWVRVGGSTLPSGVYAPESGGPVQAQVASNGELLVTNGPAEGEPATTYGVIRATDVPAAMNGMGLQPTSYFPPPGEFIQLDTP